MTVIGEIKERIRQDVNLRWLLITAGIVQGIICVTSIGVYHPDQYFQIIEFSSFQLKKPSAVGQVWEFQAQIRSTLQVYLFSAYSQTCSFFHIRDPYIQLTLLRILFGGCLFIFFNGLTLYYFRKAPEKKIVYYVLLILNFSWILPYTRTLYSSEMLSSLLFFGAIWLYDLGQNNASRWKIPLLTGLLFSLAFYARFQTGFAITGFLCWILLFEKKFYRLLPLAIGFGAGAILNTALDGLFYHHLVFTPYSYFHVNIIEGKAASMGTSSFLLYIGVLVGVILVPPLSLLLLYSGFRSSFLKYYRHPLFITVLFFIVGHCLIAHKEERFLFPILNVLPILVGWGLPALVDWVGRGGRRRSVFMRVIVWSSVGLNTILLFFLLITPYSQAIYFTWQLKKTFPGEPVTIYSIGHTPFETEAGLPLVFYQGGDSHLEWKKIGVNDSIRYLRDRAEYLVTTYNQISNDRPLLDSLGYESVVCSSRTLWKINEFLQSKQVNTINDIWVLYKRKGR